MTTQTMIELFGYLGSLLVVVSMLMTSVVKLRVINMIGSIIFAIYALIIKSYPTALMNFFLVGINIYHLIHLNRTETSFELTDDGQEMSYSRFLLRHYLNDIRLYFPDADPEGQYDAAYIVSDGTNPVGLLLGKKLEDGALDVAVDYSIPAYRDCSVGAFLYSKLPSLGVRKLTCSCGTPKHIEYMSKMGFSADGKQYTKTL